MITRRFGRAVLAAAAGLAAALVVLPAADAAGGTWGPDAVAYRNGVVCDTSALQTALVSWTGSAGGTAFALAPVQSGPSGTDEPATDGVAVPVQPSSSGLDSATIAEVAYLIATHGSDASPGVVADVAADVVQLAGSNDTQTSACLLTGQGGTSRSEAAALLTEADRLAGPYSVSLTGPTTATAPGKPIPLVAHVTSATGHPVPGVHVTFTPSAAGVTVSSAAATGTDGTTTVEARATTQSAASAAVTASVAVPVGLLESSASGEIPLVETSAAQQYTDRLALAIDTRPHPKLALGDQPTLLLQNGTVGGSLAVTGLNGHAASASVMVYGPLKLTSAGCSTYTAADWAAARKAATIAEAPQIAITGDGSYPIDASTQLDAGCYQPVARLRTTDATPNVGASVTGAVVAVAPVTVSAAPGHGGLAPAGRLSTTLHVTGSSAATWQDVRGTVAGPIAASASGSCPTTGWGTAGTAASASSEQAGTTSDSATTSSSDRSSAGTGGSAVVTSGPVEQAGCYAFRLTATLTLAGLGSAEVTLTPGTQSAPVHVITPSVSIDSLSGAGVVSGGHVSADVTVSQSDRQRGTLTLELLRQPYTYRGCFGADWTNVPAVRSAAVPTESTTGDNTYRVTSAAVAGGSACWTVVPVFTATANPAVRAQAAAGADPMLAFTSAPRTRSAALVSAKSDAGPALPREIGAGVTAVAAMLIALVATVLAARRGRRREPIDPRDQLLT